MTCKVFNENNLLLFLSFYGRINPVQILSKHESLGNIIEFLNFFHFFFTVSLLVIDDLCSKHPDFKTSLKSCWKIQLKVHALTSFITWWLTSTVSWQFLYIHCSLHYVSSQSPWVEPFCSLRLFQNTIKPSSVRPS